MSDFFDGTFIVQSQYCLVSIFLHVIIPNVENAFHENRKIGFLSLRDV